MTTLMQRGATWLGARLKTAAGRSFVLTRGAASTAAFTAAVASCEYEEMGDDGLQTSVRYDDLTIVAADVVVSGSQVEPRDGDVLAETLNGVVIQYEVLPLQKRPAVEWLDSSGILLLVHTKRIN